MANTIIIGNIEASAVMIGNSAVSAVYIGSTKIYPSGPVDYSTQYLTFEVVNGGNITITASNADVAKTIQYSTDNGSTWTSLTTSTTAQELGGTLNVGDKVLVKGTNTVYGTSSNYNTFGGTAKVNVYGNIMSLISGDSFKNNKTLTDSYTFKRLFYEYTNLLSADNLILPATTLASNCYDSMFSGCKGLTSAPVLPATTLTNYCYGNMFYGCTSLKTAPELPAKTLATYCYYYMFQGCTSLVNAPTLPATKLANRCYYGMFYGCKGLTSAPVLLATTLTEGCYYYMFYGCTSLVNAPELPAKTLATYCYSYMFQGCTRLVNAPTLPATKLANRCYYEMFSGCKGLTSAPALPATTLANYCYSYMFQGCRKLSYIKCLATDISATNCTSNWVNGVASNGTFVKATSMTSWKTGVNGIPRGWTVQNDGVTTDNWVLVNNTFDNPRKIKVDYSLIEDDNTKIRGDYQFSFPSGSYFVSYLNEPTILNFSESSGWDYDTVMENYLGMVGVIDENGELAAILEDGVEYTQIGHTSITEMNYIQAIGAENNHYLYATE